MSVLVYLLTSPSGKSYVGITTKEADVRWAGHMRDAANGIRRPLANAIRKYGFDSFKKEILMTAPSWEVACLLEVALIIGFGTKTPGGYNATNGGEGMSGFEYSDEQRAQMSRVAKLRCSAPEWRAAMSQKMKDRDPAIAIRVGLLNRGKTASPETKAKLSKMRIGRRNSPETIEKMRLVALARPPVTDEVRAKISLGLAGIKRVPHSEETREKQRLASIERWKRPRPEGFNQLLDPERIRKMADARKASAAKKALEIAADPILSAAAAAKKEASRARKRERERLWARDHREKLAKESPQLAPRSDETKAKMSEAAFSRHAAARARRTLEKGL